MVDNKKILGLLFMTLGLFALSGVLVSADFGIGFTNDIGVVPGESEDLHFAIQNLIEPTQDLTIGITVEEGADYIAFTGGTEFAVAAGEVVSVPVTISVPAGASEGRTFPVSVIFSTVSGGVQEGGTVDVTFNVRKSFDIVAVPVPEPGTQPTDSEGFGIWGWILGIIILIIIVWVVMKAMKKKQ